MAANNELIWDCKRYANHKNQSGDVTSKYWISLTQVSKILQREIGLNLDKNWNIHEMIREMIGLEKWLDSEIAWCPETNTK